MRVNLRFPESSANRLKEASAIRGQSVAAFVLEVVSREADRVLEEEKYWNLSLEAAAKNQQCEPELIVIRDLRSQLL